MEWSGAYDVAVNGGRFLGHSRKWTHGFLDVSEAQFRVAVGDLLRGIPHRVYILQYEGSSADHYGTPVLPSGRNVHDEFRYEATQTPPGHVLVWVGQFLPMYCNDVAAPFAFIGLPRIYPHRFGMACMFRRCTGEAPRRKRTAADRAAQPDRVHQPDEPPVRPRAADLVRGYNEKWSEKAPLGFCDGDGTATFSFMSGNCYANAAKYHGGFPRSLLERCTDMLRYVPREKMMHLFSGSLPWSKDYVRVDMHVKDVRAHKGDKCVDAHELAQHFEPASFDVIIADPPYSAGDAQLYQSINGVKGTARPVDRKVVIGQCAEVLKGGGLLIWLDCVADCHLEHPRFVRVGRATMVRSSNNRVRMLTICEKIREQ